MIDHWPAMTAAEREAPAASLYVIHCVSTFRCELPIAQGAGNTVKGPTGRWWVKTKNHCVHRSTDPPRGHLLCQKVTTIAKPSGKAVPVKRKHG